MELKIKEKKLYYNYNSDTIYLHDEVNSTFDIASIIGSVDDEYDNIIKCVINLYNVR